MRCRWGGGGGVGACVCTCVRSCVYAVAVQAARHTSRAPHHTSPITRLVRTCKQCRSRCLLPSPPSGDLPLQQLLLSPPLAAVESSSINAGVREQPVTTTLNSCSNLPLNSGSNLPLNSGSNLPADDAGHDAGQGGGGPRGGGRIMLLVVGGGGGGG